MNSQFRNNKKKKQRSLDSHKPYINSIVFFLAFNYVAAQELETIKKQYVKIADAYGCLGVLQVNAGESSVLYLVLVTGCFSMGKMCDSEIFRITQTQFIPLQFQAPGEDKIAEVRKFLSIKNLSMFVEIVLTKLDLCVILCDR